MKIIHIISSINKGGAENHLFHLASIQSKNKKKVKIVYFKGNGYWKKFYKKKKIHVSKFNFENNYNFFQLIFIILKLYLFLKKEKPDIVHTHLTLPEILISFIKYFCHLDFKFVVTKHLDSLVFEGSYGQNKKFSGLFFEKFIFKNANHVIFISQNVRRYFLSKINNFKKKTSVIYYGINKEYFDISSNNNKSFKNLKKNRKQFVILNIARHIPQKRVDALIKGFKFFQKKNNNSKLILVGSGPDTEKLKKLARDLNISKKIMWIKYIENVKQLFLISNVFCLTSKYEGLGLVLLESLFLKKPVITIKKSAMKEIIINSYNGILLKNNFSSKSLALAFQKIKDNHKFNTKITNNGFKYIKKKFNLKKMYNLTNQVYEKK